MRGDDRFGGGRLKDLTENLRPPLAVQDKRREGRFVFSRLRAGSPDVADKRILLIDDIADSGGTLIAAAKELKSAGALSVSAYVTHALDLKKLRNKLQPALLRIDAAFDHARGTINPAVLDQLARTA